VGEQVVVFSPSGQTAQGIAITGLHHRTYPDGAVVEYDSDYTQTGNQNVTGKVTVSVDVVAAGISLVKHKHDGVQSSGAQTGAPA